jgi:hypothetical protein
VVEDRYHGRQTEGREFYVWKGKERKREIGRSRGENDTVHIALAASHF